MIAPIVRAGAASGTMITAVAPIDRSSARCCVVTCVGGERLRIDVGEEACLPAADHLGHTPALLRPRLIATVQLFRQRNPAWVAVMDGHAFDLAALTEHIDRAPIGDLRHHEPRQVLQGLGVVHR